MLRGLRKASANWLGKVVMAAVVGFLIVSFAIWGIGDIFRGFGRSTVAKVGRTEITMEQFRQLYNDRLQQIGRQFGRSITSEQARAFGLDQQLLGQVLAEAALDERARQMRLGISDQDVARRITEEAAFRAPSGQFDRLRFEQLIRQAGYTEARYVSEQRRVALRRQIAGSVSGEIKPPRAASEAFARFENEQRAAEYIVLDRTQAGEIPPPTPEVLAKYFDDRKVLFRAPEYRKLTVLSVTPEDVARTIEVGEDELKRAYEDRRARYSTPERRQVQQILFPNVDEGRKASERIAGGLSFDALAAERGLAEKDIDLGLITKSDIADRAVADAAFSLQQGAVSAAIEGRFGGTIVRVVKIEPGHTRAFAEVAAELKNALAVERAKATISKLRDSIEDELASGLRLDEVARKLNLSSRSIDAIDRASRGPDGQPVADLPKGVDVVTGAFNSDVGVENDALQTPGGSFVWYDIVEITPSRERKLDEIRDRVEARWRDDEIVARLDARAKEMVEKAKSGMALSAIAAASKLKLETARGVKRRDNSETLPPKALAQVFRTPKGEVGSAEGKEPTERMVFRVTEIEVPAFDPASADAKRIGDTLRNGIADDLLSQYVARIESELGISVNQSALNQAIGAASLN